MFRFLPALLLLAVLLLPQSGFAQQAKAGTKLLGTFGSWKAYSYNDKDQPVCYMTLPVQFPANKKFKRSEAYLMITHRPGENSKDVVSYASGYSYKPTSDVNVEVGKKTFNLFTQNATAWSRDAATDHALASAIRNGATIKITGTPGAKGINPLADTINLKGSTQAYDAISKACGYPVEAAPKPPPVGKIAKKKKR